MACALIGDDLGDDCNESEEADVQKLTEIFGIDRLTEIKFAISAYRNSGDSNSRFQRIVNLLLENDLSSNRIGWIGNSTPDVLDSDDDDDVVIVDKNFPENNRPDFQPSIKPKRQRSEASAETPPTVFERSDTELYDITSDNDVESGEFSKMKKAKVSTADRSSEIIEFLRQLECMKKKGLYDPNVVYARLEAADDFNAECKVILSEVKKFSTRIIAKKNGASETNSDDAATASSSGLVAPPALTRNRTSNETKAEIMKVLVEQENINLCHEIPLIIQKLEEIEASIPESPPPWETLFRRLATANDLAVETRKIVDEFNAPGPSGAAKASASVGAIGDGLLFPLARHPSAEFLAETLSADERKNMLHICEVFPDVDTHFVLKEIAEKRVDLETFAQRLSNGGYPKNKTRLEKERNVERRVQFLDPDSFDLSAFFRTFGDDPESHFSDCSKLTSESYRNHALVQLQNDFPKIRTEFLSELLQSFNNHYYPALKHMQNVVLLKGKHRKNQSIYNKNKQARQTEISFPDVVNDSFFRELQFVRNEAIIKDYLVEKKTRRERRVEEAKGNNELKECSICLSDNILPEETVACNFSDLHSFCISCVRLHAEEIISQGRHLVTCLDTSCESNFDYGKLRNFLNPRSMDLLLSRNQEAEIRDAGIENVEKCPFCRFLLIMENVNDTVFYCRDPSCLRESCRLCKEPNHVPLKCDEVETDDEAAMRKFIEARMAEALIRICPRCGSKCVKGEGCNKVKCPCGTNVCYVCREDIGNDGVAYNHFTKCELHTSTAKVHTDPVLEAGEKAKQEYLEAHPQMKQRRDIELKNLVDKRAENDDFNDAAFQLHFFGNVFEENVGLRHERMRMINDDALLRLNNAWPRRQLQELIADERPLHVARTRAALRLHNQTNFLPVDHHHHQDHDYNNLVINQVNEFPVPAPMFGNGKNRYAPEHQRFRNETGSADGNDIPLNIPNFGPLEQMTLTYNRRQQPVQLFQRNVANNLNDPVIRPQRVKRYVPQHRQQQPRTRFEHLSIDPDIQGPLDFSTASDDTEAVEQTNLINILTTTNYFDDDVVAERTADAATNSSDRRPSANEETPIEHSTIDLSDDQKALLKRIESRRLLVNAAQTLLADQHKSVVNNDSVGGKGGSLRNLMQNRDRLLDELRTVEVEALTKGLPESVVYPDLVERRKEDSLRTLLRDKTRERLDNFPLEEVRFVGNVSIKPWPEAHDHNEYTLPKPLKKRTVAHPYAGEESFGDNGDQVSINPNPFDVEPKQRIDGYTLLKRPDRATAHPYVGEDLFDDNMDQILNVPNPFGLVSKQRIDDYALRSDRNVLRHPYASHDIFLNDDQRLNNLDSVDVEPKRRIKPKLLDHDVLQPCTGDFFLTEGDQMLNNRNPFDADPEERVNVDSVKPSKSCLVFSPFVQPPSPFRQSVNDLQVEQPEANWPSTVGQVQQASNDNLRDELSRAVAEGRALLDDVRLAGGNKTALVEVCRKARRIAYDYVPHSNIELSLTEISSQLESPTFKATYIVNRKCLALCQILIRKLDNRLAPLGKKLPVADGGKVIACRWLARKHHENVRRSNAARLQEIRRELFDVVEQRHILQNREDDLRAMERDLIRDLQGEIEFVD